MHSFAGGGRSFVNNEIRIGESTLPCGTPLSSAISSLSSVPIAILAFRSFKKVHKIFCISGGIFKFEIFYLSPLCQTLSNAFSTSLSARTTCFLSARAFAMVS